MASVRQRTNRELGRENGDGEVVYYVATYPWKRKGTSIRTVTREGQTTETDDKLNWQQRLSLLLLNFLWYIHDVLAWVGFVVEWTLNFLALNRSLWTLPFRCIFHFNELVFPKVGTSNYHTIIWQLDPRTKLYTDTSASAKADSTKTDTDSFPVEGTEARRTLDVTIMASKLVYENQEVVKKVVEQDWNKHFVGFYTCWNEYHKERSTEAFIFADKPDNMNKIVIAWRGTEPFNTWDWSTDVDFSWARFQNGMAVHLGFLEALGLCTRDDVDSFIKMDNNAKKKRNKHTADHPKRTKEEINNTRPTSGLSEVIIADDDRMLAYDYITKIVGNLLHDNPLARLFVTGHSLGGALAVLYGVMLYYNGETEITDRLAAIYTFGQPRVGDKNFKKYAECKLDEHRYKRVVYCNDFVPRVPFDNNLFGFKHFGKCHYYDNWYNQWGLNLQDLYCDGWWLNDGADLNTVEAFYYSILDDQPQINCFTTHITAVCELIQCKFILPCRHGPEYKESAVSILARLVGIFVLFGPEVVAHSPRNYVNAVRLGHLPLSGGPQRNLSQTLGRVFFCLLFLVACSLGYLYAK